MSSNAVLVLVNRHSPLPHYHTHLAHSTRFCFTSPSTPHCSTSPPTPRCSSSPHQSAAPMSSGRHTTSTPRAGRCAARMGVGTMCVSSTPRSLHTVPLPFIFQLAQRAADSSAIRQRVDHSSGGQLQRPQSATSLRGFLPGRLTPQSLSLTQRAALATAAVAPHTDTGIDLAVCRRLEQEFVVDHTAAEFIKARLHNEAQTEATSQQPVSETTQAARPTVASCAPRLTSLVSLGASHVLFDVTVAARYCREAVHTWRSAAGSLDAATEAAEAATTTLSHSSSSTARRSSRVSLTLTGRPSATPPNIAGKHATTRLVGRGCVMRTGVAAARRS